MRARAWALAVCLGGGLPAARAADPTQTVVRTKGAQAAAAFKAGDFAEALTLYQAVEPLMATMEGREAELATLRFNIARCYDELKRPVEAVAAYRRALEGLEDAALVARIEARVATLEAESLGIIEVRCAAPGAVVTLIGQGPPGDCGDRFERLAPGPYTVEGRGPSGRLDQRVVRVGPGEVVTVRLELAAPVETPPPAPPAAPDRTLAIALTAGAGALLVGGVTFNLLARGAVEDGDAAYARYRRATDDVAAAAARQDAADADDRAGRDAAISYALFGTGAALAAGAVWAWLDDDAPSTVTPAVVPGGVGLNGRF
ncbi:MAG: tetratricopeptide repeat protein [Myxococcales bacterium]|nr:tetratricopeptide repeat protein [Myxococcales bacterium]